MQYVVTFHLTDCYLLFVLFTFVGLPRSATDVPSFLELSFPSNPTFCLPVPPRAGIVFAVYLCKSLSVTGALLC